jgi:hypothetical protein
VLEWTGSTWQVAGAASGTATSLQGTPVDSAAPTTDQVLEYDGTAWTPTDLPPTPPTDPVAGTAGLRTLGSGAQQAAPGNDTRFSDARPPISHASTHVTVGQDTLPGFTTTTRGVVLPPGGTPSGTMFLNDQGVFADPAITAGGMSDPMIALDDLIVGGTPVSGIAPPTRLVKGTDGQVLGVDPTDHRVKYLSLGSTVPSHDHTGTGDGGALDGPVVNDFIDMVQGTTGTPAADHGRLHAGLVSGILHPFWIDETGADVDLLTTGGGGGGGGGAEPGIAPQVAPPNAASWTPVNFSGTAPHDTRITDGQDGVVHLWCGGSTGTNAQLAVKAMPATPFVIKARLRLNLRGASNIFAGIGFRSSSDGKLTVIGIQNTAAPLLLSESQYSAPNAYVGQDATEAATPAAVRDIWFKITDDGTNRTYSYCYDGNDDSWIRLSNVAATHYHTPNQVGIFGDPQSVNLDFQVTLVSWEES